MDTKMPKIIKCILGTLFTTSFYIIASVFGQLSHNKVALDTGSQWLQDAAQEIVTEVTGAPSGECLSDPNDSTVYIDLGEPSFTQEEIAQALEGNIVESYSPLDELGRCGPAYAVIGLEIMPTEERTAIGHIKPTGWHTVKYAGIDGNYLYNRCHLIAFSLAGENDNKLNLITGTRFMNVQGMLPFEMQVLDYVKDTGNHVLYRATPEFTGNNLVADGVRLEALSLEDSTISFNVFCPNIQPGVIIDYATGESEGPAYE